MTAAHKKGPSALADIVAGVLSVGLFVLNVVVDVHEPVWLTVASLACFGLAIPFAVFPFVHLTRYGSPKPGDAFSTCREFPESMSWWDCIEAYVGTSTKPEGGMANQSLRGLQR